MADSVDILKELALQIRYATQQDENTAERVGRTILGIIELLSKSDIEELAQHFIRKDQPDATNFFISFLAGLMSKDIVFGKNGFATGMAGFGGKLDENGYGEMRGLTLWEWLQVPELRYNQVKIFIGIDWQVPGAGIIENCIPDKDAEGNLLNTGTCTLKLESGQYGAIDVDDMSIGIWHFGNENDAKEDSDDGKGGFTFAGFATSYFRITEVSGTNNDTFRYSLRPGYTVHPQKQMHFACYGNFTNTERQTSTYRTRTYTRRLWKQNTWEIGEQNIAAQTGDLSNLNVFGLNMTGYSAYMNSIYFTGTILQMKPDGTPVRTANDRGAWQAGHYDYYDRVSHSGCLWLCVNEQGTDTEPSDSSADWLKQVDKGQDGSSPVNMGGWYSGLFVPYLGIVRMGGASWQCTVKNGTSNPPLWCWLDQNGNYFTYSDGNYVLTGGENTGEYMLIAKDGTDGIDGVGIPGQDGKTYYTWIRYADDIEGNGISDSPEGKKYIGIANNRESPLESNDPTDYTWALIKGEDGVGIPGNDGKTLYTWIAYSDNADGSGMYQQPKDTTKYIGVSPNHESATESNNPSDYVWSKFRGEDGRGISKVENYYLATNSASGVTTSTTGWTNTIQAVSESKKYLWNYEKITYTDTQYVTTTPAIIGQYSADGKGIAFVTEEYGVSTSQSTQPSSWQSTPPAMSATNKYLWNRETTTYTDNSTKTTTHIIAIYGDTGEKGDSVSNLGAWYSGLFVPYLGIVRMGCASWQCTVKNGTSNPPLWCWLDQNGNYLTYSDGNYVLTGGENTGEYELVAEDGKGGSDGTPGEQGIQGCIIRRGEWAIGVEWRNDEALTSGTRFLDVSMVRDNATATGWRAYKCLATHTSSAANAPGTSGGSTYWEEFGSNVTAIFTSLIIAKNASIDLFQGNQVVVKNEAGEVEAGLTGLGITGNADVRFFAGPITDGYAPTMIYKDGRIFSKLGMFYGSIATPFSFFNVSNLPTASFKGDSGIITVDSNESYTLLVDERLFEEVNGIRFSIMFRISGTSSLSPRASIGLWGSETWPTCIVANGVTLRGKSIGVDKSCIIELMWVPKVINSTSIHKRADLHILNYDASFMKITEWENSRFTTNPPEQDLIQI